MNEGLLGAAGFVEAQPADTSCPVLGGLSLEVVQFSGFMPVDPATSEARYLFVDPQTGTAPAPLPSASDVDLTTSAAIAEWSGWSKFDPSQNSVFAAGQSIIGGDQTGAPAGDLLAGTEHLTYDPGNGAPIDLYSYTYMFATYTDGNIANTDVPWALTPPSAGVLAYDFRHVVEHEVGHSAGVGHNLIDSNAKMSATVGLGPTTSYTRATETTDTINWLYGSTLYAAP